MRFSIQSIQAKLHNVKANGAIRFRNRKKRYHFIQTPEQAKALKKGTQAIVYGDATLAQLRKVKSGSSESSEIDAEFYAQANRYPNDQIASLLGKASESLNVQIRRSVIDAANEQGVKVVGVGLDGVVAKGLKETKGSKNVIMVIIHHVPEKSFYLLEKWIFKKGRLQKLEELNISARNFDNPIDDIASSIGHELSKASASGFAFKISGVHGFTNRDGAQILSNLQAVSYDETICKESELDKPLSLFNKKFENIEFLDFDTFSFPSPPVVTDAKTKINFITPAVILMGGVGAYYGLSESGRTDYQQAVSDHRSAVQQIQDVYEHGTAPISLVQTRQYFMEDHALQEPVFHDSIAGIFAALSRVHREHPYAQAKFESLSFSPDGLSGIHEDSEFELTISFQAEDERGVLPLGYQLHQSLASYLNASTQTKDLPRSAGRENSRYNLTITGVFR